MNDNNLSKSRWAPSSIQTNSADYRHPKGSVSNPNLLTARARKPSIEKRQIAQLQAYQRFLKSLRRLKWKSTTLIFCHHRALSQQTDNIINNINFPVSSDTGKANAAEIMFKVDFFEYYALLERALVHLLECFGIVITADHTTNAVPLPSEDKDLDSSVHSISHTVENSIIGDSVAFHGYAHRFHANVLAALDRPSNPLHVALGSGKIRQYLGVAKEFRNRWKEVEMESADHTDQLASMHKSYHQILTDLKLDEMLATILVALEQSRFIASASLASAHGSTEVDMVNVDDNENDDDIEADNVMFGDVMDWN